jgi:hypothetical protein
VWEGCRQHPHAEALLGFEKPLEPSAPVSAKPEKELLLMTPVSNVPDVTRYVMSACPRHKSSFLEQGFQGQKHHSKVENCPILELFRPEFNHFPWSDPGLPTVRQEAVICHDAQTEETSNCII